MSLGDQLVPGTLEHTIHYVVEERLDLSLFDGAYQNDETGRRAYDPKILLKVVLFGYARGLKGSRRLEAACRENVTFMALACGQRPDHSTIAAFISGMGPERRRLERLRKKAERIERFLAENPARMGRGGKEVQANVTDNESAKMRGSHGIVQGYNANACVDGAHQVVVHAEAKFWIEPQIELAMNHGFKAHQISELERVIKEHEDEIRNAWIRHFGR